MQSSEFVLSFVALVAAVWLSNETTRFPLRTRTHLAIGVLLLLAALAVGPSDPGPHGWRGAGQQAIEGALLIGGGCQVYVGLALGAARLWGEAVPNVLQSAWFRAAVPSVVALVLLWQWARHSPHPWARQATSEIVLCLSVSALLGWLEAIQAHRAGPAR